MAKQSLDDACTVRLKNSAQRLLKLIELNAPKQIISNEVGMLVERAAGLCGPTVLNFTVQAVARFERWRLGYCMEEGCGKMLETENELMEGACEAHIQEHKADSGENWCARKDMHRRDSHEGNGHN